MRGLLLLLGFVHTTATARPLTCQQPLWELQLAAFGISDTFLQEEWEAIQATDDEELSFCETAAGLGWDPYDMDESRQDQVLQLADELGHLRVEAVSVLDSADPLKECLAIRSALEAARPNGLQLRSLRPLMEHKRPPAGYPWQVGYDLAQQVRRHLDLDGKPIPTMNSLAKALDEDIKVLNQAVKPVASLNMAPLVDGVVTGGEHDAISFGLQQKGKYGQRFLFCRALAETISSDGDALITRGHTERPVTARSPRNSSPRAQFARADLAHRHGRRRGTWRKSSAFPRKSSFIKSKPR